MHHQHLPFHLHQSFANYGTETMQKTDLRDFSDDLLHNLHGIPDPLMKNLADTIITSENPSKTKKKLEEQVKMPEEQPNDIPTVQTSALSGILSFISGVFNSVSGAMFRPRSPVYYDCFADGDWHYSKTEQDKIGTESPVESSEMNTDSKTAVAACEGKLNQVRYLLSSPRPIGSVWVRKRPKKAFVEPGSVEESFEDAFSPEDFINLPNDSFIEYYSPYSYQNEELFETGALKTKTEQPITETTNIITVVDKEKQEKDRSHQEKQVFKPEKETIRLETNDMKSEKEMSNLEKINLNIEKGNQENVNTEISANIESNTVPQKESMNNKNQTMESTNELPASKDEVDYVATDKHQLISSCEDKLSKLKALICKTRKKYNPEPESIKPISKTADKHYKNPHRTLDKRNKTKIKKSIQDDILFANEVDPDTCIDDTIHSPINSFTPSCLGDYFDEITGRFRTTSSNSEDSFQIVFNDTPRVRLSSDCESEDSFIVFEDSPDSCYTSHDVFHDSDSETESEVSDSGCSTLTCKLSHSLSRTVSNLTDDSLYADTSDEIDFCNIEKVLKCDEILMNHDEFRDRSEVKLESDELNLRNDEIESRSDLNEVAKKTGLLLDDERKRRRREQPVKKVQFSSQPPKVHVMRVWSFAARQARAGHWERYALDRDRFKRRIADVDMAVSWVLKPQHRARIKFQRFMPWWNQQRRAELAEKKRRDEEDIVRKEEMDRIRDELVMQEHDEVRQLEQEEERLRLEEDNKIVQKEEHQTKHAEDRNSKKEDSKVTQEDSKVKQEELDRMRDEMPEHDDARKSEEEDKVRLEEEIYSKTQQSCLLGRSDDRIAQKEEHDIVQKEEHQISKVHRKSMEEEKEIIIQLFNSRKSKNRKNLNNSNEDEVEKEENNQEEIDKISVKEEFLRQ